MATERLPFEEIRDLCMIMHEDVHPTEKYMKFFEGLSNSNLTWKNDFAVRFFQMNLFDRLCECIEEKAKLLKSDLLTYNDPENYLKYVKQLIGDISVVLDPEIVLSLSKMTENEFNTKLRQVYAPVRDLIIQLLEMSRETYINLGKSGYDKKSEINADLECLIFYKSQMEEFRKVGQVFKVQDDAETIVKDFMEFITKLGTVRLLEKLSDRKWVEKNLQKIEHEYMNLFKNMTKVSLDYNEVITQNIFIHQITDISDETEKLHIQLFELIRANQEPNELIDELKVKIQTNFQWIILILQVFPEEVVKQYDSPLVCILSTTLIKYYILFWEFLMTQVQISDKILKELKNFLNYSFLKDGNDWLFQFCRHEVTERVFQNNCPILPLNINILKAIEIQLVSYQNSKNNTDIITLFADELNSIEDISKNDGLKSNVEIIFQIICENLKEKNSSVPIYDAICDILPDFVIKQYSLMLSKFGYVIYVKMIVRTIQKSEQSLPSNFKWFMILKSAVRVTSKMEISDNKENWPNDFEKMKKLKQIVGLQLPSVGIYKPITTFDTKGIILNVAASLSIGLVQA